MRKMFSVIALVLAGLLAALNCPAVDYSLHMYNARVYRVALGSGTAPTAADMSTIGIRPGDMVVNTDDNMLYIMSATNVYTKISSAGILTPTTMANPLASNKVFIGNASGVANEKTLSGDITSTTNGVLTIANNAIAGPEITAGVVSNSHLAWELNSAKLATNSTPPSMNYVNGTNLPITFTRQAVTLNYAATNDATVAVTEQTGAVTAEGANNLVTPAAVVTPQVVTPTATPTLQTGTITASGANNLVTPAVAVTIFTTTGYDSTGAAITNAAGASVLMMTNATATCSPDLASNAVVVVTVTGGDAVMTNLTIAVTPDLMTNATVAVTPDLSSNAVVAVTVTGGGAVLTNVDVSATLTAASLSVVTNGTCSNP